MQSFEQLKSLNSKIKDRALLDEQIVNSIECEVESP